ncbi:MAG: thioredoxin family protein [Nitrospirae bacterium]|nr:thioredoxin family protein [Nitrospirota bacterium]
MTDTSVLLRCRSCMTANRVPAARLTEGPRCGRCKAFLEFSSRPEEITDSTFGKEILDWPGIVVVFFWAPWCAHCRGMFPMLEDLARQKAGIIKVGMINIELNQQLASRYNVMSVPKLVLYRNGRIIDELNGAVSALQLAEWTGHALSRAE